VEDLFGQGSVPEPGSHHKSVYYNREVFKELLLRWIARRNIPLWEVEWEEFRDLLHYCCSVVCTFFVICSSHRKYYELDSNSFGEQRSQILKLYQLHYQDLHRLSRNGCSSCTRRRRMISTSSCNEPEAQVIHHLIFGQVVISRDVLDLWDIRSQRKEISYVHCWACKE